MTWSGAASWTRLGKLPRLAFLLSLYRVLQSHDASLILWSRDPSPEPSTKRDREDAPVHRESTSRRLHGAPGEELRLPAMGNSLLTSVYSHIPCRDHPSQAKACRLFWVQVLGPIGLSETFQEGSLQLLPPCQQVHTFCPTLRTF
jgi:hypothetical protein